jgi:hypothetical protein
MSDDPSALRKLVDRYRNFAERARNPRTWETPQLIEDKFETEGCLIGRVSTSRLQGFSLTLVPIAARHRQRPTGWPRS